MYMSRVTETWVVIRFKPEDALPKYIKPWISAGTGVNERQVHVITMRTQKIETGKETTSYVSVVSPSAHVT